MGTIIEFPAAAQKLTPPPAAIAASAPVTTGVRPGCKGSACPAFAICQGRCATRRTEREAAAER